MPTGFGPLDIAAVGVFLVAWFLYESLIDGFLRPARAINTQMGELRRDWMHRLLRRDNRIVDSTLIGHTMHSATFFASTTILLLAGLIGVLGSADRVYAAVANISLLLGGGQGIFEWKLVLLIGIFVYAFFKFTWALRQYNYFCAVIGSAPDARTEEIDEDACAERMARVLTYAVVELNAGVRCYYFAFAAFAWFIHPLGFIAATLLMVVVLLRRQLASPTATALREHASSLRHLR